MEILTHYCGLAMENIREMVTSMNRILFLLAATLLLFQTVDAQHPDKNEAGFTKLPLSALKTEGNWQRQANGEIYLEPREGEVGWKRYNHYLTLPEKYGNFIVDFEYKHGESGNSGLYFRVSDMVDPTIHGFEIQILDSLGKADEEMGHHDNGGIIKTKGADKNMSKKAGEWNRMTVKMKGNNLTVTLNGEVVQSLNLDRKRPKDKPLHKEGFISIQDHGLPFWVRNIQVKKL